MFPKSLWAKLITLTFISALLASCSGDTGGGAASSSPTHALSVVGGSEGSIENPVPLTVDVPRTSSVGPMGNSYYTITTDSAGTYVLTLADVNPFYPDLFVYLYSDPGFTNEVGACFFEFSPVHTCTTPNLDANTAYYIRIYDFSYESVTYTFTLTHGGGEGSVRTPLSLVVGTTPHSGGAEAWGSSYYSFSTAAQGSYVIAVSSLSPSTARVSWDLYVDPAFTTPLTGYTCNPSPYAAGDIHCAAPDLAPGKYFLKVRNNTSSSGITYAVTVASDGSGSSAGVPEQLPLDAQYPGAVYDNGYHYYYFVAPTSGTYTVTLTSAQVNTAWELYGDSLYSSFVMKCDTNTGTGAESCMTMNLARGPQYLKVYTNTTTPGQYQYNIIVTAQGGSEGAPTDPVDLAPGATYTGGRVASNAYGYPSYYKFTTGSSSSPYLIRLTNIVPSAWFYWDLYADAGFSARLGTCGGPEVRTYTGDFICATSDVSSSPVLAANTTYYLKITNLISSYQTYAVQVMPFGKSSGCNSGGTCYNFESGIPAEFDMNNLPWALDSGNPGTKAYSFKSGKPRGSKTYSCFRFTATDVKWISFGLNINSTTTSDFMQIGVDYLGRKMWMGSLPWQRVVFFPPSGGTHLYEWCYTMWDTSAANAVWVDDIELNY